MAEGKRFGYRYAATAFIYISRVQLWLKIILVWWWKCNQSLLMTKKPKRIIDAKPPYTNLGFEFESE